MNGYILVVYIERKCKQQVSRRKLKYQYKFTYPSNQGKLNVLNLDTSTLFKFLRGKTLKKNFFLFQSIRELQSSLRDGVILFRALLDELRRNMEIERDSVNSTYAMLQEAIQKQYDFLLKDLEK